MPWRRRNGRNASSIDAKASARGDWRVATDQCCIVTLTLLPALVVGTMPAYGPKLLARARSRRTWPTLEPFHQRPVIGQQQPFRTPAGSHLEDLIDTFERWHSPLSVKGFGLRQVKSNNEEEVLLATRQPVALQFTAGRIFLYIERDATVGIAFQFAAVP